jgi:hypothetical protein
MHNKNCPPKFPPLQKNIAHEEREFLEQQNHNSYEGRGPLTDCRTNRTPLRFVRQGDTLTPNMKGNVAMRIPILILSAASLVALGGLAQADDHLFQATQHGLPLEKALTLHDAPGRGSPFVAFDREEDLGTPSTATQPAQDNAHGLPASVDPHCAGCSQVP